MTASREPHHADAIGNDVELGGARTDGANRALRVAKLDRMVISRPEAILQHERGDRPSRCTNTPTDVLRAPSPVRRSHRREPR